METKTCIKCLGDFTFDQFYERTGTKDGLTSECRECKKARSKLHYKDNIFRHKVLVKRRYEVFGRFARYGLSVSDYDSMLDSQGGKCALCRISKPGGKGKWHIDHKGGTVRGTFNQCQAESVRGLLCHRCNVSLGHYEQLLKRIGHETIMRYLQEH